MEIKEIHLTTVVVVVFICVCTHTKSTRQKKNFFQWLNGQIKQKNNNNNDDKHLFCIFYSCNHFLAVVLLIISRNTHK